MWNAVMRINIGPRLALAFASIIGATLIVCAVIWVQMHRMDLENDDLIEHNSPQLEVTAALNDNLAARGLSLRNLFLATDDGRRNAEAEALRKQLVQADQILLDLKARFAGEDAADEERKLENDLQEQDRALRPHVEKLMAEALAGHAQQKTGFGGIIGSWKRSA